MQCVQSTSIYTSAINVDYTSQTIYLASYRDDNMDPAIWQTEEYLILNQKGGRYVLSSWSFACSATLQVEITIVCLELLIKIVESAVSWCYKWSWKIQLRNQIRLYIFRGPTASRARGYNIESPAQNSVWTITTTPLLCNDILKVRMERSSSIGSKCSGPSFLSSASHPSKPKLFVWATPCCHGRCKKAKEK